MTIPSNLARPLTHAITRKLTETGVGGGLLAMRVAATSPLGQYGLDMGRLWQNTDGTGAVTAVGQTVKRIDDQSGSGAHATNATGWVLAADANGALYLTMDGVSTFSAAMAPTAYPLTYMGVFLTSDVAAGAMSLWQSNTQYKVLNKQATTREWRAINRGGSGTVNAVGTIENTGDTQILGAVFRTATEDLESNGRLLSSAANSNVFGLPTTFYIGRTRALDGIMTGRFYGCVVWNKELSASEKRLGLSYMREMAGVVGNIAAVGDSHTLNITTGVTPDQFYPYLLGKEVGSSWNNYGASGATTALAVSRATTAAESAPHSIGIVYAGTNDSSGATTVQAAPAPTSTVFAVAAGLGARYGAGGIIDVGGEQAVVLSVATDTLTLTAPLAGGAPAAGTAVTVKTVENIVKAVQSLGATHTLVVGQHYLNFASGTGDTTSAQQVTASALRVKQQQAATDAGAVYVDMYTYMRALIVGGTYAQGDDLAWHTAVGDSHLNAVGEQILADAIQGAMVAQGWA